MCSHVDDFNARNKLCLIAKLLKQGYRYPKLRKAIISKFYRRHHELVSKFNVGLKSLLHQAFRNHCMVVCKQIQKDYGKGRTEFPE